MKKDDSASIYDSGNGGKITAVIFLLAALAVTLMTACFPVYLYSADPLKNYTIDHIYFKFPHSVENALVSRYKPLLHFKSGEVFNYRHIRKSMDNIYKVGSFDNIEVTVQKKPGSKVDIYFNISYKYLVRDIKVAIKDTADTDEYPILITGFSKKEVKKAIFSLRKDTYFEEDKLDDAVREVNGFLNSRGYFNPKVTHSVFKNTRDFTAAVKIVIETGRQTVVNRLDFTVTPPEHRKRISRYFITGPNPGIYVPFQLNEKIEKAKRFLRQQGYYFPEITVKEEFPDPSRLRVNLDIRVNYGERYVFKFVGMNKKTDLISSIWGKKVFEKWAEGESKARILYYLKNKGYLNAEVTSRIEKSDSVKTIRFFVDKKQKYALGKVYFQGNTSVPEQRLRKIIKTDDLVFDKLFHLRLDPLIIDQAVVRFYYILQGFPSPQVRLQPDFHTRKADIRFVIDEGKQFRVESILFEGNRFFNSRALYAFIQTRTNRPFVQQKLAEDIERLKTIYHSYGFDNIEITVDISPGTEKSILVHIKEGKQYRLGSLVVTGASSSQRKLLETLFPLKKGDPFDEIKIESFKTDIENKAIFNRFKIVKIERAPDIIDVLINVNPDSSKYYGFGIGWEERKDFRVTVEYQERNIFNSYSTLSFMVQYGLNERRGVLSYDTPYFFRGPLNSSFRIWVDKEIYPSYEFNRYGVGETLIKKLTPNSYLLGALSWYRTELTELEISPYGVDELDDPFDTTALNLSYVRERRDDTFNPTQGSFFSSSLKLGLPVFEKNYSFIKFLWRYQKNFKILSNGTFAASVRNGLASGDMSITERFFAGGFNTFRGTGRDRLGPRDPGTGKPRGGNAFILFNFETTFPILILPISDFYYSIFADVGNVYEKVKYISFKHLESAVGFSLKYKTTMGPLRFDVAWNVRTGKPEFHIGIGNVF
jgi:outer membrane protein insertion porin family